MGRTPVATDLDQGGFSLANARDLLFPCLDAAAASSVVEIGAYRGELTRELLAWAAGNGRRIAAIDPGPEPELLDLSRRHPELELIRETSQAALSDGIPPADAVIIDGDHNYYTLTDELRLVEARAREHGFPLVILHDVGWPHGRRDTYYDPGRIPDEHRQPLAHDASLAPWEPGVADLGLHYEWAARREGGPRNGVLTALEDFASERPHLRLAIVPAFFGLGVLWDREAPWAGALAEILDPWDRNPLLERLESNRVVHLVERYRGSQRLIALREERDRQVEQVDELRARLAERDDLLRRQQRILRSLIESRAFRVAEWLSWLWQRGRPLLSRERLRQVLGEGPSER